MSHRPISIKNLAISFGVKNCFDGFTTSILPGQRIGVIGNNGSGKSMLLKVLHAEVEPYDGEIENLSEVKVSYVPQVLENNVLLSGGQRFNLSLSQSLAEDPDILLLDEPTNHLDSNNRKSLLKMLAGYNKTLVIASHDLALLRQVVDTIWHIDNGKIHEFIGGYDDYMCEVQIKRRAIEQELSHLTKRKKQVHEALMQEQVRASNSRDSGEKNIGKRKWPTIVSASKARRAQETSGRKAKEIGQKKQEMIDSLAELRLPEIIKPKFAIDAQDIGGQVVISVTEGSVGYEKPILQNVSFSLRNRENMAIVGDNGSGKTTLMKAILGDSNIKRSGSWYVPKLQDIGYLDQHYNTIDLDKTVLENICELVPTWEHSKVRKHLNDFLFRKNEEVNAKAVTLSGGEKCRLSLALIAAKPPKLLLIDEITNNIDMQTKEHIIQVLKEYRGAMIIISHDEGFLAAIAEILSLVYNIPSYV